MIDSSYYYYYYYFEASRILDYIYFSVLFGSKEEIMKEKEKCRKD
jgi:hypothetical protein